MDRFADFVRSQTFTLIAGFAVIGVAVGTLLYSFFGTYISVPPVSIEHERHVVVNDVGDSAARRAGIRAGTILIAVDEQAVLDATTEDLNAAFVQAQENAFTEDPEDATVNLPFTIYAAGEVEDVSYQLRRGSIEDDSGNLNYLQWADLEIELEEVPSQALPFPDGTSLSMMDIALGGTDHVPTLNIDAIRAGESGSEAVRGVDALLILYPLILVAIILLTVIWMSIRFNARPYEYRRGLEVNKVKFWRFKFDDHGLMGLVLVLGLVAMIIPQLWIYQSDLNWRGDLIDDFSGSRSVESLPQYFTDVFHIRETPIIADVNRLDAPADVDITREALIELRRMYDITTQWQLSLLVFGVVAVVLFITFAEADGLLSNTERLWALVVLSPSLLLLAVFVYGFIGQTLQFSLTDWGEKAKGAPDGLTSDLTRVYIGLENYNDLMTDFTEFSFRNSLINTFFFTLFFLAGALFLGFILALLVDQRVRGEGIFRTIFLFPMSLSLVVTGTVWNWLLQPNGGINQLAEIVTNATLPDALGGSHILPEFLRTGQLEYRWLASRNVLYEFTWDEASTFIYLGLALSGVVLFNHFARSSERTMLYTSLAAFALWLGYVGGLWENIWPPLDDPVTESALPRGYFVALTGVVLAAIWQMAGYVMALMLAGIRGVPEEIREAARVDGCAEWQVYAFVILPSLRPVVLSAIIILGHISLKIFDLVFAMTGVDVEQTKVPGIVLYTKAFRGNRFASGSAIAIVMLVLVSLVIIPYLWSNSRQRTAR
jgi:glucose/mannose transport system permease protein